MPIYEYRCEVCGHELDALQKLSDARLTDCPECESASLKRLMSAPSFRLKGSGWYETDFKSDQEAKRNLAEQPQAQSKEDKSKPGDSKQDKKTAASEKSSDAKSSSSDSTANSEAAKSSGTKNSGNEAA